MVDNLMYGVMIDFKDRVREGRIPNISAKSYPKKGHPRQCPFRIITFLLLIAKRAAQQQAAQCVKQL